MLKIFHILLVRLKQHRALEEMNITATLGYTGNVFLKGSMCPFDFRSWLTFILIYNLFKGVKKISYPFMRGKIEDGAPIVLSAVCVGGAESGSVAPSQPKASDHHTLSLHVFLRSIYLRSDHRKCDQRTRKSQPGLCRHPVSNPFFHFTNTGPVKQISNPKVQTLKTISSHPYSGALYTLGQPKQPLRKAERGGKSWIVI